MAAPPLAPALSAPPNTSPPSTTHVGTRRAFPRRVSTAPDVSPTRAHFRQAQAAYQSRQAAAQASHRDVVRTRLPSAQYTHLAFRRLPRGGSTDSGVHASRTLNNGGDVWRRASSPLPRYAPSHEAREASTSAPHTQRSVSGSDDDDDDDEKATMKRERFLKALYSRSHEVYMASLDEAIARVPIFTPPPPSRRRPKDRSAARGSTTASPSRQQRQQHHRRQQARLCSLLSTQTSLTDAEWTPASVSRGDSPAKDCEGRRPSPQGSPPAPFRPLAAGLTTLVPSAAAARIDGASPSAEAFSHARRTLNLESAGDDPHRAEAPGRCAGDTPARLPTAPHDSAEADDGPHDTSEAAHRAHWLRQIAWYQRRVRRRQDKLIALFHTIEEDQEAFVRRVQSQLTKTAHRSVHCSHETVGPTDDDSRAHSRNLSGSSATAAGRLSPPPETEAHASAAAASHREGPRPASSSSVTDVSSIDSADTASSSSSSSRAAHTRLEGGNATAMTATAAAAVYPLMMSAQDDIIATVQLISRWHASGVSRAPSHTAVPLEVSHVQTQARHDDVDDDGLNGLSLREALLRLPSLVEEQRRRSQTLADVPLPHALRARLATLVADSHDKDTVAGSRGANRARPSPTTRSAALSTSAPSPHHHRDPPAQTKDVSDALGVATGTTATVDLYSEHDPLTWQLLRPIVTQRHHPLEPQSSSSPPGQEPSFSASTRLTATPIISSTTLRVAALAGTACQSPASAVAIAATDVYGPSATSSTSTRRAGEEEAPVSARETPGPRSLPQATAPAAATAGATGHAETPHLGHARSSRHSSTLSALTASDTTNTTSMGGGHGAAAAYTYALPTSLPRATPNAEEELLSVSHATSGQSAVTASYPLAPTAQPRGRRDAHPAYTITRASTGVQQAFPAARAQEPHTTSSAPKGSTARTPDGNADSSQLDAQASTIMPAPTARNTVPPGVSHGDVRADLLASSFLSSSVPADVPPLPVVAMDQLLRTFYKRAREQAHDWAQEKQTLLRTHDELCQHLARAQTSSAEARAAAAQTERDRRRARIERLRDACATLEVQVMALDVVAESHTAHVLPTFVAASVTQGRHQAAQRVYERLRRCEKVTTARCEESEPTRPDSSECRSGAVTGDASKNTPVVGSSHHGPAVVEKAQHGGDDAPPSHALVGDGGRGGADDEVASSVLDPSPRALGWASHSFAASLSARGRPGSSGGDAFSLSAYTHYHDAKAGRPAQLRLTPARGGDDSSGSSDDDDDEEGAEEGATQGDEGVEGRFRETQADAFRRRPSKESASSENRPASASLTAAPTFHSPPLLPPSAGGHASRRARRLSSAASLHAAERLVALGGVLRLAQSAGVGVDVKPTVRAGGAERGEAAPAPASSLSIPCSPPSRQRASRPLSATTSTHLRRAASLSGAAAGGKEKGRTATAPFLLDDLHFIYAPPRAAPTAAARRGGTRSRTSPPASAPAFTLQPAPREGGKVATDAAAGRPPRPASAVVSDLPSEPPLGATYHRLRRGSFEAGHHAASLSLGHSEVVARPTTRAGAGMPRLIPARQGGLRREQVRARGLQAEGQEVLDSLPDEMRVRLARRTAQRHSFPS